MPRTYYMSTTNKKERTNVENMCMTPRNMTGLHQLSQTALQGKCNVCSGKENTWCSSRYARLILKTVCDLEVHVERCYHA